MARIGAEFEGPPKKKGKRRRDSEQGTLDEAEEKNFDTLEELDLTGDDAADKLEDERWGGFQDEQDGQQSS